MSQTDLISHLREIVGEANVLTTDQDREFYEWDWRRYHRDEAMAVVLPGDTQEVAAVVKAIADAGVSIVPQAGNTGLAGASTPLNQLPDGRKLSDQIVVSVKRLKQIESIDATNNTMTVGAGCILQSIIDAADDADRFFPLSLGARGSCQIGGNIATNAGGINVLAYGNTRALVLGLEVVLASGEVWSNLDGLRKDNTGYDLKSLFIGSEGTLGIITKAVLKLFPKATERLTTLVAVNSPEDALKFKAHLEAANLGTLTSLELMPRTILERSVELLEGVKNPFEELYPWIVLSEHSYFNQNEPGRMEALETCYGEALEQELIVDAVIAQSHAQAEGIWAIREGTTELQAMLGASIKHDVSVPISKLPALINEGCAKLEAYLDGVVPIPFGHMGDGNLHFNVCQPTEMDPKEFMGRIKEINGIVHGVVVSLGGSISAEHGIGRLRRDELARVKSETHMTLLRAVKQALDPAGVFNPGKMFLST